MMSKRPKISFKHILLLGDSLSDRGTANKTMLLGCIPMRWVSGLAMFSPRGRFTNGLTWCDHLISSLANAFSIRRFMNWIHHVTLTPCDISDGIISKDYKIINRYKSPNNDAAERLNKVFFKTPDLAEALITQDKKLMNFVQGSYSLSSDNSVEYKKRTG